MKNTEIMKLPEGPTPSATQPATQSTESTSGSTDSGTNISALLDQRMSELPDNQKKFVLDYLTPETVGLLGVILGQEAIDYFAPFVDPNKMAVVQPRPQEATPQQGAPSSGQPAASSAVPANGPQGGILVHNAAQPAPQGPILPMQR